ncbi:twin-arginine translocation signal domain-containing protein [Streptomyces sp. SL13]|uniref:Twin-arginine translocation signal domain-containing protein n=1 Tax=Streptantibioticus silvisoli TaxID=2705255 RepID=A0AA90KIT4_9ACTN|nr:twin-arginine translocation signal domain-containing protein [Streptantibioticus silvisoli]MDI5966770.1 twin-arginine translocation signal domain-containing protein [Streptantibioticus silvisoli]MDI5973650.1 twin-arginine translocation signal domain-containing protein [Streptantibioticus silvisoli]
MSETRKGFDRRRFLTTAAVGGATIVGASALGGFDADAAFAAPTPSLDPAIARSTFAEGRITAIKGSVLEVAGSYGEKNLIQLTNATSIWKLETVTAESVHVGDGLYARGVPMPDGTMAADAVWVNIVNLYVTVRGIEKKRLHFSHGRNALVGNIVEKKTAAAFRGGALTSNLSQLKIGNHAQVLGAWRPEDDSVDIARITVGH